MTTESVSGNIAHIVTTAAGSESFIKQLRKAYVKSMIYVFAFYREELQEWGWKQYGETDDENVLLNYISRSMGTSVLWYYRLWKRTIYYPLLGPSESQTISPSTPPRLR